jgi:hypothetical protein
LIVWLTRPGPVPSVGGIPLATSAGPVPTFGVPVAYHVTYRVTVAGQGPETEDLWVNRPFESFEEIRPGSPPGGQPSFVTVYRLGARVVQASGSDQALLVRVPAEAAAGDARPDAMLADAVRRRLVLYVRESTVLGRRCWAYRAAVPLDAAGPLPPLEAGSTYADSCVDRDGIILSVAAYKDGRLVQRLEALHVEVGAAAARAADFQLAGRAVPFDEGGGSFSLLAKGSAPPGPSWEPTWLPAGFEHLGRFDVVPSQPQAFDPTSSGAAPPTGNGLPASLVAELDDVWVEGPDLIVLEQGGTMGGERFAPPTGGQQVDLGPLGRGQLLLSGQGPVLTAEPATGFSFVRLSGTVPPGVLLQVARSLRQRPPGSIVTVPGAPG